MHRGFATRCSGWRCLRRSRRLYRAHALIAVSLDGAISRECGDRGDLYPTARPTLLHLWGEELEAGVSAQMPANIGACTPIPTIPHKGGKESLKNLSDRIDFPCMINPSAHGRFRRAPKLWNVLDTIGGICPWGVKPRCPKQRKLRPRHRRKGHGAKPQGAHPSVKGRRRKRTVQEASRRTPRRSTTPRA